ncbi:MAG: hypothetical protein R3F19_17620 [Verrucomicrobiales bacterium]
MEITEDGGFTAEITIAAWTGPYRSGDGGLAGFDRNPDDLSLVPTASSLGIGHRWYLVERDTFIDASFVRAATPFVDAIGGSFGASIPIGQSLLGIWLDADEDFEPGDGDGFGWALIDVSESAVAILASGISTAPTGIIAGKLEDPPISTTSVEISTDGELFADVTIAAWTEPHLGGSGGIAGFDRDPEDLSLAPKTSSIGIANRWYLVEKDTIIDASLVRTATPILGAIDGSLGASIPVGESLLGIWLDADDDFEPGDGDRFGWALIDVSESAVAILASGMSAAPTGIIAGKLEISPISTTSVEIVEEGGLQAKVTFAAWDEPYLSGNEETVSFGRNRSNLLLYPTSGSLGIENRWFIVEEDTIIDPSFVRTTAPTFFTIDGRIGDDMPFGESLLGIWLDTNNNFEPGDGDRFGWALIDVNESSSALLASGMTSAPAGIVAGKLEIPIEGNEPALEFQFIGIARSIEGVQLTWNSRPGDKYVIEYAQNLEKFETIGGEIDSGGDVTEATVSCPADAREGCYFRVRRL